MENGHKLSSYDNGVPDKSGYEKEREKRLYPRIKLSAYLLALRPWSFNVSLMPVLLGFSLAYKSGVTCNWFGLIITALTALSVHGAGNVVNTYYDYVNGIDSKKSDDRTLVDHLLTTKELTFLGVVLYFIGCIGFVILTAITPIKLVHLAIVYFGGLSGSFLYTGGIGFKYIALGDVLVLIIFGPITVLFSYMVQTGSCNWGTIYYAIPLALNAEAILHSNNTRDLEADKKAGIETLAIIIGLTASEVLYGVFLFAPFTIFIIWGLKYSLWLMLPIITLPEAFSIERHFRTTDKQSVPKRTAKLNIYMGLLYTVGVFLSDSKSLPFINEIVT
ncbi:UNVERIFIED_CONTAM: hypothetical protein RMT77_013899 [Armadillidium vulgare]